MPHSLVRITRLEDSSTVIRDSENAWRFFVNFQNYRELILSRRILSLLRQENFVFATAEKSWYRQKRKKTKNVSSFSPALD